MPPPGNRKGGEKNQRGEQKLFLFPITQARKDEIRVPGNKAAEGRQASAGGGVEFAAGAGEEKAG